MMTRAILAFLLALATPALADQLLPQGRILDSGPSSGDILFGALKLGNRQSGKITLTPDALAIQGAGSTGDASGFSAQAPDTSILATLSEWLGLTPRQAASITALRTISAGKIGDGTALVLAGYYAPGDGGGGTLVWSRSSTAAENPCTVYKPAAVSGAGRWLRTFGAGGELSLLACGAKGDYDFVGKTGTDNTTAIQAAIALSQTGAASGQGRRIVSPPGAYLSGPLTTAGQLYLAGNSGWASTLVLKAGSNAPLLTIQTTGYDFPGDGHPTGEVSMAHVRIESEDGKGMAATRPKAHGISWVRGAWGTWVRLDDVTIYNMPGSGISSGNAIGFLEANRSYFIQNGAQGVDSNSNNDWRLVECDWSLNNGIGLKSSGDSQFVLLNPNIYSSGGHGLYAFNSDIKIVAGSLDHNGQSGARIEGMTAGKTVSMSAGTAFGANSLASTGAYSDIDIVAGSGNTVTLSQTRFRNRPNAQDATSGVSANVNFGGGSTVTATCTDCTFAAGSPSTANVTNIPAQFLTLGTEAGSGWVLRGPSSVIGSFGVTGATTLTGNVTVNGAQTIKSATSQTGLVINNGSSDVVRISGFSGTNDNGLIQLKSGGTNLIQLFAGGTSFIAGGSFGVGTTSPGALLDVAGTMRGQTLVLSAAPTAANIPTSYWTAVKRTDDGSVKMCANDAGAIKCVAMQ